MKTLKATKIGILALSIFSFTFFVGCKDDPPTQCDCEYFVGFEDWKLGNVALLPDVYTSVHYQESDIKFWAKFDLGVMDTIAMNIDSMKLGSYALAPSTGWTTDECLNYDGSILVCGFDKIKVDFDDIPFSNKKVEFDVNFDQSHWQASANPFEINGNDINTMPSGVTMKIDQLTNGCHITLEGPIDYIEWDGWETGHDNLCVNKL